MRKVFASLMRAMIFLPLFMYYNNANSQQSGLIPFFLKINSYRGSIQWEQSFDKNIWEDIPNGKSDSLKVSPIKTTYYRARIKEPNCEPVYSDVKAVLPIGKTFVSAKTAKGKVLLPKGSLVKPSELTVISFYDQVKVKDDGTFEVLVADSLYDEILIVDNPMGAVLMLGHFFKEQETYEINSETTGLALLSLFPAQKPIHSSEKSKFSALYKNEKEFQNLLSSINKIHMSGGDLFSKNNVELITDIQVLITKDFNKERLSLLKGNYKSNLKTLGIEPILSGAEILGDEIGLPGPIKVYPSGTSSITLSNSAPFSYTGKFFLKDGTPIGKSINIAGSLISGSSLARAIFRALSSKDSVNLEETSLSIDLKKDLGLKPNAYEMRVTSGNQIGEGRTSEDNDALLNNVLELISITLVNFVSLTTFSTIDNECIKSAFDAHVNTLNIATMVDVMKDGGGVQPLFVNYILPIFKDVGMFAANAANQNCLPVNKALSKLLLIVDIIHKSTPSVWYTGHWASSDSRINGCVILNNNFKTSNCYVLEKVTEVLTYDRACAEVELKVKAVQDNVYYPKTSEPVPNVDVYWISHEGAAGFGPDRIVNSETKTDKDGYTSIKWLLPNVEVKNLARAFISLDNNVISQKLFESSTIIPKPKININETSNNQTGAINKELPIDIQIAVEDISRRGGYMKIDEFTINWRFVKGSGKVRFVSKIGDWISNWSWMLGSEEGEQIVEAVIKSKREDCSWQIQGSPIIFKANAVGKKFLIVSGENQTSEVNSKLEKPLLVKVIDAEGKPLVGVKILWSTQAGTISTTQTLTNEKGESSVGWTLGFNSGEQVLYAKAFSDNGKEITGSPLIFKAKAISYKLIGLTGDNQTGETNTLLPKPLIMKVVDQNDNPIQNFALKLLITNGSTPSSNLATNENGEAQTFWTLGSFIGTQTLSVKGYYKSGSEITGSPIEFKANAVAPKPAYSLIKISGDLQEQIMNRQLDQFKVRLVDKANKPLVGYNIKWDPENRMKNSGIQLSHFINPSESITNNNGEATTIYRLHLFQGLGEIEVPVIAFNNEGKEIARTAFKFKPAKKIVKSIIGEYNLVSYRDWSIGEWYDTGLGFQQRWDGGKLTITEDGWYFTQDYSQRINGEVFKINSPPSEMIEFNPRYLGFTDKTGYYWAECIAQGASGDIPNCCYCTVYPPGFFYLMMAGSYASLSEDGKLLVMDYQGDMRWRKVK